MGIRHRAVHRVLASVERQSDLGDHAWKEIVQQHHGSSGRPSSGGMASRSTPPATASTRRPMVPLGGSAAPSRSPIAFGPGHPGPCRPAYGRVRGHRRKVRGGHGVDRHRRRLRSGHVSGARLPDREGVLGDLVASDPEHVDLDRSCRRPVGRTSPSPCSRHFPRKVPGQ